MTRYIMLSSFVWLLFILSLAPGDGAVWYVHPDSTLNSIQQGLDSCSVSDTVLVAPAIYYENLVWPNTQGICLISEYGSDTTIIDGDSTARVITIATYVDTMTIIKGFTIQRGVVSDSGAGILCGKHSSPKITNNKIMNNRVLGSIETYGGGIYCDSFSSPVITDNTISDNCAGGGGGGICCLHSYATVTGNIISDNSAGSMYGGGGAGILCIYGGNPVISGNTIIGNSLSGMYSAVGAGIACFESSPQIVGNIIIDNANNSNAGAGGGIYWFLSNPIITNNTIMGNYACSGGGIWCGDCQVIMKSNDIRSNTALWYGAGIYCNSASLVIDSCTIANNNGDGVCVHSSTSSVVIHYTNITGNTGYGVFNDDPSNNIIDAEYNWWGDPSGPGGAGPGTGDSVSQYVDYDPWLEHPVGVKENKVIPVKSDNFGATIFSGPLQLPKARKCIVYDITGRTVAPNKMRPGIYFIEIDGTIIYKVIKIK